MKPKTQEYKNLKIRDMSKKLSLVIVAICTVLLMDCQTKNKTQKTANEQPQLTASGETKTMYRVVVGFTSQGSGIDSQKYDAIETFIKNHAKKPAYDINKMGREGERDICLQLNEMSKSEQSAFVDELKRLAQGSDRVTITENTERVKKQ
jgi:hypothetical protein